MRAWRPFSSRVSIVRQVLNTTGAGESMTKVDRVREMGGVTAEARSALAIDWLRLSQDGAGHTQLPGRGASVAEQVTGKLTFSEGS